MKSRPQADKRGSEKSGQVVDVTDTPIGRGYVLLENPDDFIDRLNAEEAARTPSAAAPSRPQAPEIPQVKRNHTMPLTTIRSEINEIKHKRYREILSTAYSQAKSTITRVTATQLTRTYQDDAELRHANEVMISIREFINLYKNTAENKLLASHPLLSTIMGTNDLKTAFPIEDYTVVHPTTNKSALNYIAEIQNHELFDRLAAQYPDEDGSKALVYKINAAPIIQVLLKHSTYMPINLKLANLLVKLDPTLLSECNNVTHQSFVVECLQSLTDGVHAKNEPSMTFFLKHSVAVEMMLNYALQGCLRGSANVNDVDTTSAYQQLAAAIIKASATPISDETKEFIKKHGLTIAAKALHPDSFRSLAGFFNTATAKRTKIEAISDAMRATKPAAPLADANVSSAAAADVTPAPVAPLMRRGNSNTDL